MTNRNRDYHKYQRIKDDTTAVVGIIFILGVVWLALLGMAYHSSGLWAAIKMNIMGGIFVLLLLGVVRGFVYVVDRITEWRMGE